ncbi:pentapeptide repeat-containing protein [Phormidium sp. CLA17]|uniref:pentapeptide repeat-containing protein n=1 Tax=Leptolyngbya sp. Cla-17 TaxID=2803751 RepID=UPI001492B39B|nr:pentapeptide repeat-containing protein [Leptolyngbya sp. Cla-17]MBM0743899.1 pentapeptide repeat-containing protein [Leptolyngbya sp. Cla-17]
MKAQEVLNRYAVGERNFRKVDLRTESLKGKNLSGADFSEADLSYTDIRGTNFSKAILIGTNFNYTKCGLQYHYEVLLSLVLLFLSAIAGYLSGIAGLLLGILFDPKALEQYTLVPGISVLLLLIIFFNFTFKEGYLSALRILILGLIASSPLILGSTTYALIKSTNPQSIFEIIAGITGMIMAAGAAGAISLITMGSVAVVGSAYRILTGAIATIVAPSIALGFAGFAIGPGTIILSVDSTTARTIAAILAISITLVGNCVGWKAFSGDKNLTMVRELTLNLTSMGGTSFQKSNLANATFRMATLKATNFIGANLFQTAWIGASLINQARVGDSYLQQIRVQELSITGKGQNQTFDTLNLEGVNLQGANLQDASFIGVNLNYASLQDADLSRAKIKQAQLEGANLTGAILTGAYIEDWGITITTKLDKVQCEYIYMRVPTKENPNPLRKPDNLRETFAEGEFADFIKPYVDTLDLYHSQNVDPRAISIAIKNLATNYPEAQLEFAAMEKRGQNGLNLKFKTVPTADKSELSAEYFEDYNQLKVLPTTELVMLAATQGGWIRSLTNMIETTLKQRTVNIIKGDYMPEGINISGLTGSSIGGIVDGNNSGVTGQNMTGVAGSEISGTVTNTISQLPNSIEPNKPGIKELLTQLHQAIEEAAKTGELSAGEKTVLLEQLKALVEAQQTPDLEKKAGLVQKAQNMFGTILKGLPDTAKLAEACSKLMPMILKALVLSA